MIFLRLPSGNKGGAARHPPPTGSAPGNDHQEAAAINSVVIEINHTNQPNHSKKQTAATEISNLTLIF